VWSDGESHAPLPESGYSLHERTQTADHSVALSPSCTTAAEPLRRRRWSCPSRPWPSPYSTSTPVNHRSICVADGTAGRRRHPATCANTEASFGHRGVSSDGSPAVKAARPSKRRVPHESMAAGWVVCDRPRGAWWQLLALRAACRPLCDLPVRRQCLNSSCSVSCQSTTSPPFKPKLLIFGDTSDAWEVPASDLRSRGAPHGEGGTQRARSFGCAVSRLVRARSATQKCADRGSGAHQRRRQDLRQTWRRIQAARRN